MPMLSVSFIIITIWSWVMPAAMTFKMLRKYYNTFSCSSDFNQLFCVYN